MRYWCFLSDCHRDINYIHCYQVWLILFADKSFDMQTNLNLLFSGLASSSVVQICRHFLSLYFVCSCDFSRVLPLFKNILENLRAGAMWRGCEKLKACSVCDAWQKKMQMKILMITCVTEVKFHYNNENQNEILVWWCHHFLCSSWVSICYHWSRLGNESDKSFNINNIFSILKMTENNSVNILKIDY